jgi:AcrR family transcriptional regulator
MLDIKPVEVLDPLFRRDTVGDRKADRIEPREGLSRRGVLAKADHDPADGLECKTSNRSVGRVTKLELNSRAEDIVVPPPARFEIRHRKLHVVDADDVRLHDPSIPCSSTVSNIIQYSDAAMNSKRRYHSPTRDQAAEETRAAIRRGAHELFVDQGYVPTTMKQIAGRAAVAERTLYLAYPTKAALLNDLIVRAVRGEELDRAVSGLPDFEDIDRSSAADEGIKKYVDAVTALYSRAGGLLVIGEQAAAADVELRDFADAGAHDTLRYIRTMTNHFADIGQLRPGLTAQHAADIVYAVSHFTTHHLLTTRRRWSRRQYQRWLTSTLIETITADASPRPTDRLFEQATTSRRRSDGSRTDR